MIKNKKAIELSVRFLVIIILAIVIFGFSIKFLYDVMSKVSELQKMTQEDLDRQIEEIQCDEPICIGINYKRIERGKFDIFGLTVHNDAKEQQSYSIVVTPLKGYTEDDEEIDNDLMYLPESYDLTLQPNQGKSIGIGIEVPKTAKSAVYIFNVNIDSEVKQIRVEVP